MFPSDGYFEDQQQPYSKPLFRPFSRPSLQKVPSGASCMPSSVATTGSAVDQQGGVLNSLADGAFVVSERLFLSTQ